MDQDEYKWKRWRWEFLRDNEDYQADYQKVEKLRGNPNFTWIEEREYCVKWGLSSSVMPDPSKSFDELLNEEIDLQDQDSTSGDFRLNKWAKNLLNKWVFIKGLDPGAVNIIHGMALPDGSKGLQFSGELTGRNKLLLQIDFDKVNSLASLKEAVSDLLEKSFNSSRLEFVEVEETEFMGEKAIRLAQREKPKKPQVYQNIDYDLLLMVGRMKKQQHLKNREIAEKIDPKKFRDNFESATRNISHLYKRYKELVNGGYKQITFP